MNLAIIGSGISGLSAAQMLREQHEITVYEQGPIPGGLIRCTREQGHLYHRLGGHVFNSKIPEVLHWFWQRFHTDQEFIAARRNAKIWLDNKMVGYPIENHLHQLPAATAQNIIGELLRLGEKTLEQRMAYPNFQEFLRNNFGETLYQLYFKPYNEKLWQENTANMPLDWLEGKLPMPGLQEIIEANILRQDEESMVHATFFYPKENGSQFIIDRLAQGVNIKTNTRVERLERKGEQWTVNGHATFDTIVYTGDIRHLSNMLPGTFIEPGAFQSKSTSNCLCETDDNDLSWLYLPDPALKAHRIIYTGNFSPSNNAPGRRKSCVVEFSGFMEEAQMKKEIKKLPGNLEFVTSNHEAATYVIQNPTTRKHIEAIKNQLEPKKLYLSGRFAEWEYHNMDKCIESAMIISSKLLD
jgi:protoporphyrinogen oxidase